jgi:hypothetical protein
MKEERRRRKKKKRRRSKTKYNDDWREGIKKTVKQDKKRGGG